MKINENDKLVIVVIVVVNFIILFYSKQDKHFQYF